MTSDYAILVADDEAPFTETRGGSFGLTGLQTKVAHSAREALGLMSDGVPQLLILDVMMPEIDGLTLMGQVKSNTRWDGIPVVIASASVLPDQRSAAFTAGADVFLAKPFNSKQLRAALRPYVAIPDTADLLTKRGG